MPEALLKVIKKGVGTAVDLGSRYQSLLSVRNQYLDRGKDFSKFTLPYILPENDGDRGGAANQYGYQNIGAQATNHLSNKLATTMFPVQRSFFKLEFSEEAKTSLEAAGYDPTALSEILVEAEKRVEGLQDEITARTVYIDIFKNLIIGGNCLLYVPPNDKLQAIKLSRYCCRRDASGNLIELVIENKKNFSAMSQEIQDTLRRLKGPGVCRKDDEVVMYTWVYRVNEDTFAVTQSAIGVQIKPYQEISGDDLPWIPLMWNHTNGEDYGRGLVEDHAGDFYVLEFLSEALAKGMALMADIKYFLKRGSTIDIDEVATSPTGEWILGNRDDVGVLQLERFADFSPISEVLNEYRRRVGQVFLLNSAVRRDAERVTTLELRLDAQELETSLGGVYSLLSQTWQAPMALKFLKRVGFPLPDDVTPKIVTGLSALGRIGDLDKVKQFTEMMQLTNAWPQQILQMTKWDVYAREVAAGLSMKLPFIMSNEEWKAYQQQQAQAQQAQVMQEAAAGIAEKAGPEIINNAMKGQ
jgi:hypothetical protein